MTLYKQTQGHITFKNMSDLTVKHKVVSLVGTCKKLQ